MKPVFSTLMAASLMLFVPQIAEACPITKQWSQQDIAFADVIFEGSLTDVKAVSADKAAGGRDFFEFTFDVHDVVRGKLQQDEIVVGWMTRGYGNPSKLSLEKLKKSIGETTRVAISTPQLAGKFCELKLRGGSFYDEDTETNTSSERMQPVCDYTVASLEPAFIENMPFVLSNGYICGRSYFFPVQRYENMRNYEKNYEAFKKARHEVLATKEGRRSWHESGPSLRREMVPEGQLMWRVPNPSAGNSAVNLVRDYKIFFTPALKDNAALQDAVLDLGIAIARHDVPRAQWNRPAWFERDEATRVKFRDDLRKEILRLVDYMEKDLNFRNRLLEDD